MVIRFFPSQPMIDRFRSWKEGEGVGVFVLSDTLMKRGTLIVAPVSRVAGLLAPWAVLPFSPGSVCVTSSVIVMGISMSMILSSALTILMSVPCRWRGISQLHDGGKSVTRLREREGEGGRHGEGRRWGEREKEGKRVYLIGVAASALTVTNGHRSRDAHLPILFSQEIPTDMI